MNTRRELGNPHEGRNGVVPSDLWSHQEVKKGC